MPALNRFLLVGKRLAIDFANSVYPPGTLVSWPDLLDFLAATGVLAHAKAAGLKELEKSAPGEAGPVLSKAMELRAALRQILEAITAGWSIPDRAVDPINDVLRLTEGHDQLVHRDRAWEVDFIAREQRLEWLLAAVARSGAALLKEGTAAPIRKCANPKCALFFYDDSRTGKRRWCSMAVCGNRSKVAEFAKRRVVNEKRAKAARAGR